MSESTKIVTGAVIFSYCHVFEPDSFNGSEPAYSVQLIINKSDTKTVEAIKGAIKAAYEAGKAKLGNTPMNKLRIPLRDGDADRPDDPLYAGRYFMNAKTKTQPEIVDKNRQEILDPREFYSGCIGRASINFFTYNTSGSKGIGVGLNNLQKLADGTPLGGRSRASDDFGDDANNVDLGGFGNEITTSAPASVSAGSEDEDWLS